MAGQDDDKFEDGVATREQVDAFLKEVAEVCRKHKLSLDAVCHEIGNGGACEAEFMVGDFSEHDEKLLLNAVAYFPKPREWF